MPSIQPCALPDGALLLKYAQGNGYTDCWTTAIARAASQPEFVEAFYTGFVFKLERTILAWLVSRPSTDAQVRELAAGTRDTFAAWKVEACAPQQLLLTDFRGSTRSWLMSTLATDGASTRLYLGSAVVPRVDRRTGEAKMGFAFSALLGFHRLYSRVLLHAAAARLMRASTAPA